MATKRHIASIAAALVLAASGAVSCGPSYRSTVSRETGAHPYVEINYVDYTFWADDHRRSRRNADHIFDVWATASDLERNVSGKRLLSITPREEGCYLTYDYRMTSGDQRRVTLVVNPYRKAYRKEPKERDALVDWPHLRPGVNRLHYEEETVTGPGGEGASR